jgi:hypothetical protein
MRLRNQYSLEVKFSMDHVPYVARGEGNSLEEVLEDATYNVDCPDPKTYTPIGELPQKVLGEVMMDFASEMSAANDYARECAEDRKIPVYAGGEA